MAGRLIATLLAAATLPYTSSELFQYSRDAYRRGELFKGHLLEIEALKVSFQELPATGDEPKWYHRKPNLHHD